MIFTISYKYKCLMMAM